MTQSTSTTMEPLSARIPSDLYLWLAQLKVEGASTNSDKLRVLLGQLKRQHDGAFDFVAALAWCRDLAARPRNALALLEAGTGRHSEVLSQALEHISHAMALLISAEVGSLEQAAKLEDKLVRRSLAHTESLMRQATTPSAAAFDPDVVQRHLSGTLQLAQAIQRLQHSSPKGD
ncbi:hypothetical protein [Paucibacter sp. KCTC 42545]|uniref:hypothetical protein n=1 Tax=Paucibacter sp. KCTC 42545 TaxID=1768242 RepID=UPI000733BE2D|nr:hypothetical protein [Paucibacter sp. KCTC 42545]ALT79054.1 hypothetical protein AT984_19535 [Paucibacter sp. KCTC 42545]